MPEENTAHLIHFTRADGSWACGRLLDTEAGSTLSWPDVTCRDCLTIRRKRRRAFILVGVVSAIVAILVAVIVWVTLPSSDGQTVVTRLEPSETAVAPIVTDINRPATATPVPPTLQVEATPTTQAPTLTSVESPTFAKPQRGVRLQWVEESPTWHLLVDAENPDHAFAKLDGRGNCWYVIGGDGERLPGACTAFGVAQGNARTHANQTLACPPEQPMCTDPDYLFVQWMQSRISIVSGGSVTVATDCAGDTLIETKESISGFGGPRTENYHSYMAPAGYYEQKYRAPDLSSGGSLGHMLLPRVAGIGECWIGFRDHR